MGRKDGQTGGWMDLDGLLNHYGGVYCVAEGFTSIIKDKQEHQKYLPSQPAPPLTHPPTNAIYLLTRQFYINSQLITGR